MKHIEALVADGGSISIGALDDIQCVAGHWMLILLPLVNAPISLRGAPIQPRQLTPIAARWRVLPVREGGLVDYRCVTIAKTNDQGKLKDLQARIACAPASLMGQ